MREVGGRVWEEAMLQVVLLVVVVEVSMIVVGLAAGGTTATGKYILRKRVPSLSSSN